MLPSTPFLPPPNNPPPSNLNSSGEAKLPSSFQTNAATVMPNPTESSPILLKCVCAKLFSPDLSSLTYEGIVLLDDCNTHSYIHTPIAKQIKLPLTSNSISVGVFNDPQVKSTSSFRTNFGIQLLDGRQLIVNAAAVGHLTLATYFIPYHTDLLHCPAVG
jgi:hypothetical protein